MKERPILFSAPMVRAILAGTKTQTRRIVKWRDPAKGLNLGFSGLHAYSYAPGLFTLESRRGDGAWESRSSATRCPYGQPEDRLWVRETFARIDGQTRPWIETDYRATYTHGDRLGDSLGIKKRWSPAIHMPRHASRLLLDVTAVRVERLQSITEADAAAEGVATWAPGALSPESLGVDPSDQFRWLWTSINGPDSWGANPWVWVVEFERAQGLHKGSAP